MSDCDFIATTKATFDKSIDLVKRYKFQIFDALVVASALEANCHIIYSEDMQHKMIIEDRLTIVNPFI
jgi:predicted nucleic acid-binding protein